MLPAAAVAPFCLRRAGGNGSPRWDRAVRTVSGLLLPAAFNQGQGGGEWSPEVSGRTKRGSGAFLGAKRLAGGRERDQTPQLHPGKRRQGSNPGMFVF